MSSTSFDGTYTRTVRLIRIASFALIFLFGLALLWSLVTYVDEIAQARGEVIPVGDIQIVQSLNGGKVVEVLVDEGDSVGVGTPLVAFDPVVAAAGLLQLESQEASLYMEKLRLESFLNDSTPDFGERGVAFPLIAHQQRASLAAQRESFESSLATKKEAIEAREAELSLISQQIPAARKRIRIAQDRYNSYERLYNVGSVSRMDLLNREEQVLEAEKNLRDLKGKKVVLRNEVEELQQEKESLTKLQTEKFAQRISEISGELSELKEALKKARNEAAASSVCSPVEGLIKSLPLSGKGAVLPPGGIVAEIVPLNEGLEVEVRISTRDIGFVEVGQKVLVKIDAFDYSRYGAIDGVLSKISPSSFSDPQTRAFYYKGIVTLQQLYVGDDHHKRVQPGMTAEVDIVTGKKTIFQYLLKPIYTTVSAGFHER